MSERPGSLASAAGIGHDVHAHTLQARQWGSWRPTLEPHDPAARVDPARVAAALFRNKFLTLRDGTTRRAPGDR